MTEHGSSELLAEPGHYHLYISYTCPSTSRLAITRKLKRLEDAIGLRVVVPRRGMTGGASRATGLGPGALLRADACCELYVKARVDYTGRVTVLWERQRQPIVNNESRELLRMLDTEVDACGDVSVQFALPHLRAQVDATLDAIYPSINNSVYHAGFRAASEHMRTRAGSCSPRSTRGSRCWVRSQPVTRIIPLGPMVPLHLPHDRAERFR